MILRYIRELANFPAPDPAHHVNCQPQRGDRLPSKTEQGPLARPLRGKPARNWWNQWQGKGSLATPCSTH